MEEFITRYAKTSSRAQMRERQRFHRWTTKGEKSLNVFDETRIEEIERSCISDTSTRIRMASLTTGSGNPVPPHEVNDE